MANNSFDLKNIGLVYLSDLTVQDFPASQAGVGHVLWDGSNFVVQTDNQGQPQYTSVPSYKSATTTLAADNTGLKLVPVYDISTGNLVIRDSNNNDYTPRSTVAAQNVAIIGSVNANLLSSCVGGVYLEVGSQIQPASAAYMRASGANGSCQIIFCSSNVAPPGGIVASFTLYLSQNMPTGRNAVPSDSLTPITLLNTGWYDIFLVLNISQDHNATADVFGLRLVVT